jgi:hypothetical protein
MELGLPLFASLSLEKLKGPKAESDLVVLVVSVLGVHSLLVQTRVHLAHLPRLVPSMVSLYP